ncbi:hypothetical protein PAXRUDRAFT_829027 [Paxillus rubicundulus Ve08.2h10]|uniref:Uncharacterized protein n=1 Tax=Paxillus rubicundulus Ve08.2h10 TaxID=930991 RepID=A0A0D0DNH0_9AGAM|nr:hypothetical protein PAXRUDRAFT_829027 [Paxillus rubicundulus Ve08.2h10]
MQYQVTDRSKLRMERLRQMELEQLQWEQEALVMPEDLNRALFLSFESVKTEFSDLDGLSWSRYPVPLVTNPWAHEEPTPKLACTELGEFPSASDPCHDTRPSTHTQPPPLSHSPHTHGQPHLSSKSLSYAISSRAELASLAPEDTIRASRLAQSSRAPLQPANQFFGTQAGGSHKDPHGRGSGMSYAVLHSHSTANSGPGWRRPSHETPLALLRSQ